MASTSATHPFPPINPFNQGYLNVGVNSRHSIYYEQSGNPSGNPVVYIHGGPGGGTSPVDRQYFDPECYRIVVFDQRGAGKSTPAASLDENDTWSLVEDIEQLRAHLNIERWVVFGGSWGSTLALSYAITHPSRVKALILRGIFLLRHSEIQWFYQSGASNIFPDHFSDFVSVIPPEERHDLLSAYYKRLTSDNESERLAAAKAWSRWECATSRLIIDEEMLKKADEDTWSLAFARIECHYFVNKGFFESDGWLLENVHKLDGIPGVIVQGRYDVVCPMQSAWDLHNAWKEAELHIVPDAGHSAKENGIKEKLIAATEKYKNLK